MEGQVADWLPVGVWVARAPGGELVYTNPTFGEIMGMGALDDVAAGGYAQPYGIYGRDGQVYPEERMPFVQALRARATVTIDDIVIHRRDGTKVNIRATARPVFSPPGDSAREITHIVIAFIDITREIETEARLQRALRMEAIGNLAGGIAHDFNNLLAAVKLLASMLRHKEPDPQKREDLQRIDDVTESAVHLTRSLLGFAGRGKHLAAPLAIDHVAHCLADIVRRTFDRRIEVIEQLEAGGGVMIGDLAQIEQVVMNLLVNARDAMPEGGRLEVRTRREGTRVILEVADTGVGIDPALRDRIFEPYFTTKAAGSSGGGGSGLGLATVYGIVEIHAGSIEVLDNQPRGTVMRVSFPAADRRVVARERPPRDVRPGSGTILLVEDEAHVRAASARALELMGYEVLPAPDGVEALDIYRRRHKDLTAVILDMVMPRMAGRQAYLELREINPDVPVLLTTGYAFNEEAQAILDLGVRGFLPKPYDAHDLSEALARVFG